MSRALFNSTSGASVFPLSVSANGRYLVGANGQPFLMHGDTCWSIEVQLTNAQIDSYFANRAAKGVTAILFEAIEHRFSSQSPEYENVDGDAPFSSMTDFGSTPVDAYWDRVDYIVNKAKDLGIVCIINPAYMGFAGGIEGWMSEINAEDDIDLQGYGEFLASRYTQGNVIWCMGGDYSGSTAERNKQWNVVTGMRIVRTTDIITAHGFRDDPAHPDWIGYIGFNLNNAYTSEDNVFSGCATEYARSGPMPFFLIEAFYENDGFADTTALRRQSYQAMLSGACGQLFGNTPIWHFGSPNRGGDHDGGWVANLDSTGSQQQVFVKNLFAAYAWWKLEPKTDTSLVSSSLSSGVNRICPARASDGSFAMIWVPGSSSVTVVMSAMTPSSVRARLYNTTTGAYTTVAGSPFANSGSQIIATGGERVIVLDAA